MLRRVGWAGVSLLWVLVVDVGRAQAGPWTRPVGSWYAKLSQGVYVAQGYRDADGRFIDDATYTGHTTSLYTEAGVLDRLQAQLYLPFLVAINSFDSGSPSALAAPCPGGVASGASRRGFGDARAGLQLDPGLLPIPHAFRLEAKLPLYDVTQPQGQCGDLFPQHGDGQVDATLWLSVGGSLLDGDAFAYVEFGHIVRTDVYPLGDAQGGYAQTLGGALQGGYKFMPDGYAMLSLRIEAPYEDDGRSKGGLSLGPQVIVPLGGGFSAEADLGFSPWAVNGSQGRSGTLYWTAAAVGISHKH